MGEPSWNNRVVFLASNTLTFTKRAEAVISNSDSKSSVLHLRCQLPGGYFSVEAVAGGGIKPKSRGCPRAPGRGSGAHSGVSAPWLPVLRVTTQQHPVQTIAAESPGC